MTVLLVLATFIALIAVSFAVRSLRASDSTRIPAAAAAKGGLNVADFRLPKGVFFHPGHTWAALQPEGNVKVGLDDFIQQLIRPIHEIIPPEIGTEVDQGAPLFTLQVDSQHLVIPAPISGRILSVNRDLLARLPLAERTNLTSQWVVNFQPGNLQEELTGLPIAAKAKEWLRREFERLVEFLESQSARPELAGQTLQDGGEPVLGVLHILDDEGIKQFENEFLKSS
ncbi:MAG: hypothetical protein JSW54_12315 [Fidelibacterota bacterium]|nr:MAG: hypothetical protein JSW54_12315 [Candidatus Neomarinimicrobiota bacterium]